MKKGIRISPILFLVLALILLISGCGSEKTASGKKVYIVGTDAAYAPMEYINEKGEIVGIDIDVMKAVAEAAGIEIEFKNLGWDPLFLGIKNQEVDIAISSITIRDDRKIDNDFSEPYFVANQLILVPEGSTITKFEDLKNLKVGVQNGTTGHFAVQELMGKTNPNIKAYDLMPFSIQAMLNGEVDAVVGDNFVVLEFIKQNPDVKFNSIDDPYFEKENYGIIVKKGNTELLQKINEGLKKIKESGKLKEITGQDLN